MTADVSDAGNAVDQVTSSAFTYDVTAPTAFCCDASDSALKSGETATLTITFSEAVTAFANADLTIPNGSLTAVSSADGGTTWTATIHRMQMRRHFKCNFYCNKLYRLSR